MGCKSGNFSSVAVLFMHLALGEHLACVFLKESLPAVKYKPVRLCSNGQHYENNGANIVTFVDLPCHRVSPFASDLVFHSHSIITEMSS